MAVIKLKISDEQYKEIENGKLNVVLFNKEDLEESSAGMVWVPNKLEAEAARADSGLVIPKLIDFSEAKAVSVGVLPKIYYSDSAIAGVKALKKAEAVLPTKSDAGAQGYYNRPTECDSVTLMNFTFV